MLQVHIARHLAYVILFMHFTGPGNYFDNDEEEANRRNRSENFKNVSTCDLSKIMIIIF